MKKFKLNVLISTILIYLLVLAPLISIIFVETYSFIFEHFGLPELYLTNNYIQTKGLFIKLLWISFSVTLLFLMKFRDHFKQSSLKKVLSYYLDCFLLLIIQVILISIVITIVSKGFPGSDFKLFNNENFFIVLILLVWCKLTSPLILLFACTAYDGYNSFSNFFFLSFLYLTDFLYFFVPNISNIQTPGKYFFDVEINNPKNTIFQTVLKSYLEVFFMYLALGFAITLTAFFSLGLKEKLITDS